MAQLFVVKLVFADAKRLSSTSTVSLSTSTQQPAQKQIDVAIKIPEESIL
jgi:hypothetical protein